MNALKRRQHVGPADDDAGRVALRGTAVARLDQWISDGHWRQQQGKDKQQFHGVDDDEQACALASKES